MGERYVDESSFKGIWKEKQKETITTDYVIMRKDSGSRENSCAVLGFC